MELRVISETNTSTTIGWDPVPGVVEYRGTRAGYVKDDGTQRWSQAAPTATSMRFLKDDWYEIQALTLKDHGRYPPPTVFPSTSMFPSEVTP